MAWSRETTSFMSDHFDEKATLKHYWADMYAESEPLLGKTIKVRPIAIANMITTANTLVRASVATNQKNTQDAQNSKRYEWAELLQFALSALLWARKRIAFTVEKGCSVVVAHPPRVVYNRSKLDRYLGSLLDGIKRLIRRVSDSAEQRKRREEVEIKMEGIVAEILGDASKDMRAISSLATDPDFQRRGYGGALVDFITSLADGEGRATYLLSSNPTNTEFYSSRGFVEIGKVMIGEGNTTWKEPPLPILLMVRPFDPI